MNLNRYSRKINLFYKKNGFRFMCLAGVCIVFALFLKHTGHIIISNILFSTSALLCGLPVLHRALMGLSARAVGIEVLVSIAVIGALSIGEFSEAGIVTFLFQLGSELEQRTLRKTRDAIRTLSKMAPETAVRIGDDEEEEIDIDEVEIGDVLLVRTGDRVPVDGKIIAGEGYLMEAAITGESVPVRKGEGTVIYAGTILDSGTVKMCADKVGEDTSFGRIIALVEEAQDAKSPAEKFIDRFARWYTPSVVIASAAVFLLTRSVDTAITVLVLACPGALVIGAPVANVAGIGRGAGAGILLKGGESVTAYARTDTFVFDKTGTLTAGHPQVTDFYCEMENSEEIIALAAGLEHYSEHPLAKAVCTYAKEQGITVQGITAETIKGMGIRAEINHEVYRLGSQRLMDDLALSINAEQQLKKMKQRRESIVMLAKEQKLLGIFGIRDEIRHGAAEMIASLKKNHIRKTVMITGDHQETADIIAAELGIDEVYAQAMPEDKLRIIARMQQQGRHVAFIGDGVNDSPALALADTGIAVGCGTDVAIETSDVVLIGNEMENVVCSLKLARKTVAVLYQNIVIAVGTVVLLLAGLLGGIVHMSIGMFVHEASILVVIVNAMRLLRIKISDRR